MKTKKVLPLILLLFVAIMLFSVGMIAKEYRERQQDIKGFEKLEEIITEAKQTEITGDVEQTETPQEQKQSSRNLTPLFEANGDCIGWICIPNTAVNYPVMFTPEEPQKYLRKNFEGEYSVSGVPFLDGASSHLFALPEVKLLIDAVESSKFITAKKSSELANKLSQMTSVYQSEGLKRNIYISQRVKPMNEQIYYLVDNINTAINQGKQISFLYYHYNQYREEVPNNNGKRYHFSPYYLVWNEDHYSA